MKANAFEKLIRKVVREEIDYALRREIKTLKEDLREDIQYKQPTQEEAQQIAPQQKNSLREKIMGKQPMKDSTPMNFTSNPMLNDLLNETAQGDTRLEGGGNHGMVTDAEVAGATPAVAEAITRDYSDLMGAIYKKK